MIHDRVTAECIHRLSKKLDDMAHSALNLPLRDSFEYAMLAGRYQGMQEAIAELEGIEEERDI